MYGYRDPEVEQAAAAEDRAAALSDKKADWQDFRARELVALLETRPLLATMPACYAMEREPTVSAELVEWVMQTSGDAARTLAEAIYSPTARYRLHRLFAEQAAEHEASKRPESAWED
jgi:hypothetical protein